MVFSDERQFKFVTSAAEAQPLLDYLRAAGIDVSVSENDDMGGMNPAMAFVHGSYLQVPQEQLEEAERLVAEYEAAPTVPTPELDGSEPDGTAPLP